MESTASSDRFDISCLFGDEERSSEEWWSFALLWRSQLGAHSRDGFVASLATLGAINDRLAALILGAGA